jgi:uncharacterized protein YuzE
MAVGSETMNINYNVRTDLLYIRLDDKKQPVVNHRVTDDIVLDIGKDNKIIGIEILNASRNVNLGKILPVNIVQ